MAQFVNERYQIFKSQDYKNGAFDLTFDVEGKEIYAHKYMLLSVSEVFNRMVSGTWNNGESIKIEAYSYNNFYELLTFLYSGECSLTDENIFVMVDLSEFYQIKALQQKCDEYLSQKEYTKENVLMFFEGLSNYTLPLFEKAVLKAMKENGLNLVESDGFMETSKEIVKKIACFEDRFVTEEKLFEKVYQWTEKQITNKQNKANNETFDLNNSVKSEIKEFLPFINFKKMKLSFLISFVVKKGFLFSYDELSEMLENAESELKIKVKITNSYGQSISCMLPHDSPAIENIKSLKKSFPFESYDQYQYWQTQFKRPTTPSPLKKRDGVEWYLLYLRRGQIGVFHNSIIHDNYYLIAEMTAETSGFGCTGDCKIEIE
uniref:BTB domain-containing protein n=1 Tax=Panagrolaimus davidi TaxID=227884 RepID=A0A914R840_9BILA